MSRLFDKEAAEHWRTRRATDTFTAMRILVAVVVFVLATVLMALDVAPFPTWFYVFTWYPTLIVADTIVSTRGTPSLFGSPRKVFSLLGWSAVIWLMFEAINLRIANWYYIFLPASLGSRWLGIVISFGTVVPAVVLSERLLHVLGVGRGWKPHPVIVRPPHLHMATALGLVLLALPMVWPTRFYASVWGAGLLLADPIVYRRRKSDSLIADIESGRWDRIARLLLGGLAIGFWWEMLNYWARGRWVYTVPFLEQIKLFEMPPFGFVGFPVFALSAWSLYHFFCAVQVAVPSDGPWQRRPLRVAGAVSIAIVFSLVTLVAMDRRTVSSTVPYLDELPAANEPVLATLREASVLTPFQLSRRDPAVLARQTGLPDSTTSLLVQSAKLATLRGIGTTHLVALHRAGITSICELATAGASALWRAVHGAPQKSFRPTEAEVRVWIRAAERACED